MALEGTGAGANRDDRPNAHVNQPVPDDGTYITRAYNYGLTQSTDPTQQFLAAENWRLKNEPGYQPAQGFKVQNGQVVYDQGSWLANNWGLLVAGGLLGVGAYAAIAGGAGASAAAGAGAAPAAGSTGALVPGVAEAAGVTGAAGTAAVPATTGALGTAGTIAKGLTAGKGILDAASALAQGRANGRAQEALVNQSQDRNAINAAQVNLGAGQKRGAQAVQGDILANAQPFKFTGSTHMVGNIPVPDFTGGVSPALFSDSTRQLGSQLSSDALNAQTSDHGNPAQLTPVPQAGTGDKILSTAGLIGSLYNASNVGGNWLDTLKRYKGTTTPTEPDFTAGYG